MGTVWFVSHKNDENLVIDLDVAEHRVHTPKMGGFLMENPIEMDLRVPQFLETSIWGSKIHERK